MDRGLALGLWALGGKGGAGVTQQGRTQHRAVLAGKGGTRKVLVVVTLQGPRGSSRTARVLLRVRSGGPGSHPSMAMFVPEIWQKPVTSEPPGDPKAGLG